MWEFYGFMEPRDWDTYGPLPRKRWIAKPGEKQYRLTYKAPKTVRPAESTAGYNEQRAKLYAEWLAARDGIEIPLDLKCVVDWSGINSAYRKHKTKRWDGSPSETPAFQRRIQSVSWGRKQERFNTRKDGQRGAWTHNEFVAEITIQIPNWDFEHPPLIEDTDLAEAA